MAKTLIILSALLLLPLNSCEENIDFDKGKISAIIQKIENSINQDNLTVFQENSSVLTFYNFNSLLCKVAAKKNGNRVFVIKPYNYEWDDDQLVVEVFLNYLMDFTVKSAGLEIPPDVMQKIVSLGLPNKAYFRFSIMDERYYLTEIEYPFRYKYMEYLENVL